MLLSILSRVFAKYYIYDGYLELHYSRFSRVDGNSRLVVYYTLKQSDPTTSSYSQAYSGGVVRIPIAGDAVYKPSVYLYTHEGVLSDYEQVPAFSLLEAIATGTAIALAACALAAPFVWWCGGKVAEMDAEGAATELQEQDYAMEEDEYELDGTDAAENTCNAVNEAR